MDTWFRQLLSLPRKELQAAAKEAGVPANLKSSDIVAALSRKGATPPALEVPSANEDLAHNVDAMDIGSPGPCSPPPLDSLPRDLQPLHHLGHRWREGREGQGLALHAPLTRLPVDRAKLGSPTAVAGGGSGRPSGGGHDDRRDDTHTATRADQAGTHGRAAVSVLLSAAPQASWPAASEFNAAALHSPVPVGGGAADPLPPRHHAAAASVPSAPLTSRLQQARDAKAAARARVQDPNMLAVSGSLEQLNLDNLAASRAPPPQVVRPASPAPARPVMSPQRGAPQGSSAQLPAQLQRTQSSGQPQQQQQPRAEWSGLSGTSHGGVGGAPAQRSASLGLSASQRNGALTPPRRTLAPAATADNGRGGALTPPRRALAPAATADNGRGGALTPPRRALPHAATADYGRTGMLTPPRCVPPPASAAGGSRAGALTPPRGHAPPPGGAGVVVSSVTPVKNPMPMKSPMHTPARRVSALAPAGVGAALAGGAAAGAAHGLGGGALGQPFYDEVVRRDLRMPNEGGSRVGFRSVTGLAQIKTQLGDVALSVVATPPGATQGATTGRAGAAGAGEAPWFRPLLLFGPSGNGKTSLARALAQEVVAMAASRTVRTPTGAKASAPALALYIHVGALLAKHGADADKVAAAVFRAVHARSGPAIVILDSLEALLSQQRDGTMEDAEAACRLRTQLLVCFDEVLYPGGAAATAAAGRSRPVPPPLIVVGCAGGHAESVDDTLARAFTAAKVYVPPPDADTRESLLFLEMATQEADLGVDDIEALVKSTEGNSGGEVLQLCALAAGLAQGGSVCLDHFRVALERTVPSFGHAHAISSRGLLSGCDYTLSTAAAAERIAAAAEDGTSLPVRLATDVVRFLYGGTGRREPADGGVVSASLLDAKPAVGGIGVEPRGGGVLRVLFTVASDAVADTVVRWRHELRRCVDSTAVFDVLSDREEAQHQALWPAFLAAKVAGKRAQFHRARLVVDGERVPAPAC
ncbi:hypothetical protein FOA52_001420 [Chlamydomonas sp. UWO 241]|nr:hypothetical protein FOA52_001420 [Chlamydomonas sp. UWO 241]